MGLVNRGVEVGCDETTAGELPFPCRNTPRSRSATASPWRAAIPMPEPGDSREPPPDAFPSMADEELSAYLSADVRRSSTTEAIVAGGLTGPTSVRSASAGDSGPRCPALKPGRRHPDRRSSDLDVRSKCRCRRSGGGSQAVLCGLLADGPHSTTRRRRSGRPSQSCRARTLRIVVIFNLVLDPLRIHRCMRKALQLLLSQPPAILWSPGESRL